MKLIKIRNLDDLLKDPFIFVYQNLRPLFLKMLILKLIEFCIITLTGIIVFLFCALLFSGLSFREYSAGKNIEQSVDTAINNIGNFSPLLIICGLLFLLISISLSFFSMNIVPIYMELYLKKSKLSITFKQILHLLKKRFYLFFQHILIFLLLSIPVILIYHLISFLLIITIIGPFVLPILLGSFYCLLFFYLNRNQSHPMDTITNTFSIYKKNTYRVIIAPVIFCFGLISMVFILSLFSNLILNFSFLSFLPTSEFYDLDFPNFNNTSLKFIFTIIISFSIFVLIQTVFQVQQGLIFYSSIASEKESELKAIL